MVVALRAADGISKMWQSNILSFFKREKKEFKIGSSSAEEELQSQVGESVL